MFMDNAYVFQIFLHKGFPTLVTTDQGGEFRSLDAEMMKELGIRHHFTTPYHPRYLHVNNNVDIVHFITDVSPAKYKGVVHLYNSLQ